MLDEAIFEYRQIIEILISEENKTDSTVWSLFTIGNVFGNQGELDEAVALYREAIQIFQHLENQVNSGEANNYQLNLPANIHKNLGIALCKQGKFEEGIFEFEKASKLSNETRYQEGCSIRIKQAKEGNTLSKVKFENL
jgi:tetratricopeptide (TPR) repeat protein